VWPRYGERRAREPGETSINRAIALLRAEGLVRVEHGRGAFVQEIPTVKRTRRIPREDQAGSSFAEEMRKAGLDPRTARPPRSPFSGQGIVDEV
jgi:hypothetical protein